MGTPAVMGELESFLRAHLLVFITQRSDPGLLCEALCLVVVQFSLERKEKRICGSIPHCGLYCPVFRMELLGG